MVMGVDALMVVDSMEIRMVGGSSASHIALTDDSVDSYEHNVIKLAEHSVLCSYHTEGGNLN